MVFQLSAGPREARFAMGGTGRGERQLLSLLRGHRMKCLLRRMLDETEFLSDYGVRAISKIHEANPYVFGCCGKRSVTSGISPPNRIPVCSAETRTGAAQFGCP